MTTPQPRYVREESSLTGFVIFGAVAMMVLGAFEVVMGLTALFQDNYYEGEGDVLVFSDSFTLWGWTHIALGALVVAAGFALLRGQMWGRVLGVVVAVVTAIVNAAFLATAPFWSVTVIALCVVVIYAIVTHGSEVDL